MSLTCDPRAPETVPDDIMAALPPDPEITELVKEREEYRMTYGYFSRAPPEIRQECDQLRRQIDSLQKQRDRKIKVEYRRNYFERIHDEELERIIKKGVAENYIDPVVHHQLLERAQLQEVICDLSKDLEPSDVVSRRICAINLLVALSHRQEPPSQRHPSKACPEEFEEPPLAKQHSLLEDPFPLICQKTQCIICIGDNRKTYKDRMRTYSTAHKMMNHVDSHLKDILACERFSCCHPICQSEGLVLDDLQCFKNHVAIKHHINLRP